MNNQSQSVQSTDNQSGKSILCKITLVSPFRTLSLAGTLIVYTSSYGTNKEKYFNNINY